VMDERKRKRRTTEKRKGERKLFVCVKRGGRGEGTHEKKMQDDEEKKGEAYTGKIRENWV
jgi:hypothetical protein